MKIHHLNCASLYPLGSPLAPSSMVCHCLLLEEQGNLTLVDCGLGVKDVENPQHFGKKFLTLTRPKLSRDETALKQIEHIGFKAKDVKQIVLTHLDLDHTGGLPDFPQALVHVLDQEHRVALQPKNRADRERYMSQHWVHQPIWVLARLSEANWFGFPCTEKLPGFSFEIRLVSLPGHSLGHCGVAIKTQDHWLLHAGDSYFQHQEMNFTNRKRPWGMRLFQRSVAADRHQMRKTQEDLYQVLQKADGSIQYFCSHDSDELKCFQSATLKLLKT